MKVVNNFSDCELILNIDSVEGHDNKIDSSVCISFPWKDKYLYEMKHNRTIPYSLWPGLENFIYKL